MARQKRRKRRYGTPPIQREIIQKQQLEFQPQLNQLDQSWLVTKQENEFHQEEEDISREDESLDLEEQLEIERMKNEDARQMITSLIQDITSYKALIEEEKKVLESELCAERNNSQDLEDKVAELSEALLQTIQEHEEKITFLEKERMQRSSEMVGNLQLLIKELNYIEERNEELQQQLDSEKKITREVHNQLLQSKEIIEKLNIKVAHLEGDKEMLLKTCTEQYASVPSDMFIQTEKQKLKLQAELQATKDDKANVFQLLEKEKMKTHRIATLVQQIVTVAEAPTIEQEPFHAPHKILDELRKDLHKLGEEYKDTKRHILNDTASVKEAVERLKSEITTLKSSSRWIQAEIEHKIETPATKRTVSFSKLPPRTNLIQEHVPTVADPSNSSPASSKECVDSSATSKHPLKSFSLPRFQQAQDTTIKENKNEEKKAEQTHKQLNSKTESLSRIDLIRNLQAPYASNIERIQRRLSTTKELAPVGWKIITDQQGIIYQNKITGQTSRRHPAEMESFVSSHNNKSFKRNISRTCFEKEEQTEEVEDKSLHSKKKELPDMKLGLWIVVALPLSIIIHNLIRKLLTVANKKIKQRDEE